MQKINKQPLVGVILVNFNSSIDTLECISSLQHQSYKNIIIYVYDNGSDDLNISLLKKISDKNIKKFFLNKNYGFPTAVNMGFRQCLKDGVDYIWSLNNDTIVNSEAIKYFIDFFIQKKLDKQNSIVSSRISYFKSDKLWFNGLYDLSFFNFPKSKDKNKILKDEDYLNFSKSQYLTGCSLFFHKNLFKSHDFLNETFFLYGEDLAFTSNTDNFIIQKKLVEHKVSASSNSINGFSEIQAYWYIRGNLIYYFKFKQINIYEKIIYILITMWVPLICYVRSYKSVIAYIKGIYSAIIFIYTH